MKIKSKKTVKKRFTITAKGKLMHAVGQWNHLRMKKGTKVHERKGADRSVKSSEQTRQLRRMMGE